MRKLSTLGLAFLVSEELLDTEEVAALLGVGVSAVHMAVKRGRLPHVDVGRRRIFTRSDVERYRQKFGRRAGKLTSAPSVKSVRVDEFDLPVGPAQLLKALIKAERNAQARNPR